MIFQTIFSFFAYNELTGVIESCYRISLFYILSFPVSRLFFYPVILCEQDLQSG